MKKLIYLLLLVFLFCQRDDICTGVNTPNLKIGFFQIQRGSEIQIQRESVRIKGEGIDSLILGESTVNEISLPLDLSKEESVFQINLSKTDSIRLKVAYKRDLEFISKACGFRYVFSNISIEDLDKKEGIFYDRIKKESDVLSDERQYTFKIFFINNIY